ncbi:MAG TPA: DUF2190 family protein [Polyangiaceae bacterium]|jgi:hypothetical protein|nr:DUF2190 family protein [Polyangiaceae bacterium]
MSFQPRELPILSKSKKNSSGSIIPKGTPVKLDTATDDCVVPTAATTDLVYGIARSDIAVNDYGDIGVVGTFIALAGGTITRGQRVGPDATGKIVAATADKVSVIGMAERSAVLSDLFEVTLGVGITTSV